MYVSCIVFLSFLLQLYYSNSHMRLQIVAIIPLSHTHQILLIFPKLHINVAPKQESCLFFLQKVCVFFFPVLFDRWPAQY